MFFVQAQEEAARKQAELQRQKEEALRKVRVDLCSSVLCVLWFVCLMSSVLQKQQEHLKDMKLPPSANWARQPNAAPNSGPSVADIQRLEAAEEKKREQEQVGVIKVEIVVTFVICSRKYLLN